MPRFRLILSVCLLATTAWLCGLAVPSGAQETPKQDAPKQEEKPKAEEEKPTPWPPPDTEKQVISPPGEDGKELVLHTPKAWKKGTPKSTLRLAEFAISPAEGDTEPVELTIFSFAGGGGGVKANVERWINQFQPQGRKLSIVTAEGHQGLYILVDLKGTYNMPDGPPIQQKTKPLPNGRMLGVILGILSDEEAGAGEQKQAQKKLTMYFLKMAGPEKTVTANEEALRLAIGATNRSKETPFEENPKPSAPPSN